MYYTTLCLCGTYAQYPRPHTAPSIRTEVVLNICDSNFIDAIRARWSALSQCSATAPRYVSTILARA